MSHVGFTLQNSGIPSASLFFIHSTPVSTLLRHCERFKVEFHSVPAFKELRVTQRDHKIAQRTGVAITICPKQWGPLGRHWKIAVLQRRGGLLQLWWSTMTARRDLHLRRPWRIPGLRSAEAEGGHSNLSWGSMEHRFLFTSSSQVGSWRSWEMPQ